MQLAAETPSTKLLDNAFMPLFSIGSTQFQYGAKPAFFLSTSRESELPKSIDLILGRSDASSSKIGFRSAPSAVRRTSCDGRAPTTRSPYKQRMPPPR